MHLLLLSGLLARWSCGAVGASLLGSPKHCPKVVSSSELKCDINVARCLYFKELRKAGVSEQMWERRYKDKMKEFCRAARHQWWDFSKRYLQPHSDAGLETFNNLRSNHYVSPYANPDFKQLLFSGVCEHQPVDLSTNKSPLKAFLLAWHCHTDTKTAAMNLRKHRIHHWHKATSATANKVRSIESMQKLSKHQSEMREKVCKQAFEHHHVKVTAMTVDALELFVAIMYSKSSCETPTLLKVLTSVLEQTEKTEKWLRAVHNRHAFFLNTVKKDPFALSAECTNMAAFSAQWLRTTTLEALAHEWGRDSHLCWEAVAEYFHEEAHLRLEDTLGLSGGGGQS